MKTYIYSILTLLLFNGCVKDPIEYNEKGRIFTVNLSFDESKAGIDGVSMTWADNDKIVIAEVIDDNNFGWISAYCDIVKSSISPDRKSAQFKSNTSIIPGKKYRAFFLGYNTSFEISGYKESRFVRVKTGSDGYYFGAESLHYMGRTMIMSSNDVVLTDGSVSNFRLKHHMSIIELSVKLSKNAVGDNYKMSSVRMVSSGIPPFFRTAAGYYESGIALTPTGLYNAYYEGNLAYTPMGCFISEISQAKVDLNKTSYGKLYIPVYWNPEVTKIDTP